MDRLHVVIPARAPFRLRARSALLALACVLGAFGCDDGQPSRPPPSRVEAVTAQRTDPMQELCDVAPRASDAPTLSFPELASGEAPGRPTRPRWLNVWATWCRPCVEEMPLIVGWSERMHGEAADVELVFLSSDATDEAVATFREAHPDAPETLRMQDPDGVAAWATSVGLDPGATLPIHVFTDAENRVRCARTGALSERDYQNARDIVRRLGE